MIVVGCILRPCAHALRRRRGEMGLICFNTFTFISRRHNVRQVQYVYMWTWTNAYCDFRWLLLILHEPKNPCCTFGAFSSRTSSASSVAGASGWVNFRRCKRSKEDRIKAGRVFAASCLHGNQSEHLHEVIPWCKRALFHR